jgi:hypothetical protein
MSEEMTSMRRLDKANIELSRELSAIKSSLDIYTLIGLNLEAINTGKRFLAFVQRQSLHAVALGLAKVFEREGKHELCSVRGVYRLAKHEQIQDITAVGPFVSKYGIPASEDWVQDVTQVFAKQRPWIHSHMQIIDRARNTVLAHMQQDAPRGNLPSIAAFEELLGFAFEFHAFVNAAFLNAAAHPILVYREVATSLLTLLRKTGVSEPVEKFEDEEPPAT